MPRVLIIDDNADIGEALGVLLELHDIDSSYAPDPEQGLAALKSGSYDLVIQDMNFTADTTSGRDGIRLFSQIRELDSDIPVILLTAWANLETAVQLVKAGAADYLSKPWDDLKLLTVVKNLLELRELQSSHRAMTRERQKAQQQLQETFELCGAVYASDAMHQVLSLATQVAHADVPVLITGSNGTGKDLVAAVIQANSARAGKAFVTVNVGALPRELIEAELFGAEPGAYTGANRRREGRFEVADGGTLFLDEIGNLSPEGQMKLLRILQTGQYERLGSSQTRTADVRIISATNSNLKEAIDAGDFREDLFYRLNVIEIRVPDLAQRRDDILPLAQHFLEARAQLAPDAELALLQHDWPGNVRELQNMVQRACLLRKGTSIQPSDLGLPDPAPGGALPDAAVEPNEEELRRALKRCDNNISRAARSLGLTRQALYRRLSKHGIKT